MQHGAVESIVMALFAIGVYVGLPVLTIWGCDVPPAFHTSPSMISYW
jgi:hypothetical protein